MYLLLYDGTIAQINAEDYSRASQYVWHLSPHGRVMGLVRGEYVYLSRFLMSPRNDEEVDHKHRDKLDHRKENLRICDSSQNKMNRPGKGKASRFKGVTWFKPTKRWRARISAYGKHYTIGYFKVEEDAARAYDRWAVELHGEFAFLNFPR